MISFSTNVHGNAQCIYLFTFLFLGSIMLLVDVDLLLIDGLVSCLLLWLVLLWIISVVLDLLDGLHEVGPDDCSMCSSVDFR